MTLSFPTDMSGQTVIRVYTVCNSLSIFWMHYSTVKLPCSNFRVITANFLGVRIFRIFTVFCFYTKKVIHIVNVQSQKQLLVEIMNLIMFYLQQISGYKSQYMNCSNMQELNNSFFLLLSMSSAFQLSLVIHLMKLKCFKEFYSYISKLKIQWLQKNR